MGAFLVCACACACACVAHENQALIPVGSWYRSREWWTEAPSFYHVFVGYQEKTILIVKDKNHYISFNPLTPKMWLWILSSCCYTFPCKIFVGIWY